MDPNQLNLLIKLRTLLKNPGIPALLDRLSQSESLPIYTEPVPHPIPTSPTPTLLRRMEDSRPLTISRESLNPLGEENPQKRKRSPPLFGYSERTLISRLHNPKKKRHLTPISRKSSPSSLHSMNPEYHRAANPRQTLLSRLETGENMMTSSLTLNPTADILQNDSNSLNRKCPGSFQKDKLPGTLAAPVARKLVGYSEPTTEISRKPNSSSKSRQTLQMESLPHSGNASSREKQSTSTNSLPRSTMLSLMRRERVAWETRRSLLESLNRRKESQQQPNGPRPGEELLKLSPLPFPIDAKNSSSMETTSSQNSLLKLYHPITNSSYTTSPSATKSQQVNKPYLPTSINSADSTQPLSYQMELRAEDLNENANLEEDLDLRKATSRKSATNSMREPAKTLQPIANTDISASPVGNLTTEKETARMERNEIHGLQPKYLRHNLWDEDFSLSPATAEWSEHAKPLPRPPITEFANYNAMKTISDHPNLFQVRSPINVDIFESLLKNHPNPLFVKSICTGLREGFWPWADSLCESFPITHDESRPMPTDERQATFIRKQCFEEQKKGYFSEAFGTDLLPGMYTMPIYAVPKPHSTDLRLVTDHSVGPFSLNKMIDHSEVTGFPLDNMRHLGKMLFDIRRSQGDVPLTLWKSDIADAYRLLPMHPLWQIKQIITVDNERFVDRNLAFGSSGSPAIFISFNSLVAWIAKYVKLIKFIFGYVDDSSGSNKKGDTTWYAPYGKDLPTDQCRLLLLWDELGIPHKERKQVHGSPLTIIGIDVDANLMTLSLPQEARNRLLSELRVWASVPPKTSSGAFKLKHWERLAGWFNWALNVYPLLRPALNNVYAKMNGKGHKDQRIHINNAVRDDLTWAINHIESSDGVHLFKSFYWTPSSADFVIYCDACPDGMGFWYLVSKDGYYAPTPIEAPTNAIFYFESLCVLSALIDV